MSSSLWQVAEVVVHPEYAPPAKYHDVALLRLARPARLSAYDVRPACLDTDVDADPVGQEAVATGWGATFFGRVLGECDTAAMLVLVLMPLPAQVTRAANGSSRLT